MQILWDPVKAATNLVKHGFVFEDAMLVFKDRLAVTRMDRYAEGEERWITTGLARGLVLLVAVHTWRNNSDEEVVRIISARRATK